MKDSRNEFDQKTKPRLLLFCAGYPSYKNQVRGIFTHRSALNLSKKFDLKVVHLAAFNFRRKIKKEDNYEGISVIRLAIPQVPHFDIGLLMYLNNILYRFFGRIVLGKHFLKSWDVYHSNMLIPTSAIVAGWADKFGKLHIGEAIGDDVNIYLPKIRSNRFFLNLLKKIDKFQFNSKALLENFQEYTSFPFKSFVLYKGVDLELFCPKEKGRKKEEPLRFLYLGGIQTYDPVLAPTLNTKGGHILMDAWVKFDADHGNAKLIFGGTGLEKDRMLNWKNKLNKPENVEILELLPPNKVSSLIQSCDVVVIPSLNEGLPNLANETQACGIPVLATNAGGIPESVKHGKTGIIIPKNDVEALYEAMKYIRLNSLKISELGNNGRKRMEEFFSWENYGNTIANQFQLDS